MTCKGSQVQLLYRPVFALRCGIKEVRYLSVLFIISLFFASCTEEGEESASDTLPQTVIPQVPAPLSPFVMLPQESLSPYSEKTEIQPIAVIKSGVYPLWFELASGNDCPSLISSPSRAALIPFTPWPLSRLVTSMFMLDDKLVIGVNREGFLVLQPWRDGGLALYRITNTAIWENYTIDSLFLFEGDIVALIYRNTFFEEARASAPSPRFFTYNKQSRYPIGVDIPSFATLNPEDGWDIEGLRQGASGHWYYRGVQNQSTRVYFRTRDLSEAGETITSSAFINSASPISHAQAPSLLRGVLTAVFNATERNQSAIAGVISPDFSYTRYFAPNSGVSENVTELFGYYTDGKALVIRPSGSGFFGAGDDIREVALPKLPDGFFYTRIGYVGDTIIASWEEQEGLNVGAAGLMIIATGGLAAGL